MAGRDPIGEEILAVVSEWSSYGQQSASRVGNAYPIYSLTRSAVIDHTVEDFPNPGYIFLVNRGELTGWDYVLIRPDLNKRYKHQNQRECYFIARGTPTVLEGPGDGRFAVLLDLPNFDPTAASNLIRHPEQNATPAFFARNAQQRIFGPLRRVQVSRDSYESLEAIQFQADLTHKYGVSFDSEVERQTGWRGIGGAIAAGRAGMEIMTTDVVGMLVPTTFEKGMAPMPKGKAGRVVRANPIGIHIMKGSKAQDAAWEYVAFQSGPEAAKLMLEAPAAGLLARHHHLDAVALEKSYGSLIDGVIEHLLHAAEEKCDALHRRPCRTHDGFLLRPTRWQLRGRKRESGGGGRCPEFREHAAEGPREPAQQECNAEASRARQHLGEKPARGLLRRRALVLDADAGEIDEMHIVHAAWAGGHAGEAGEAAVDMVADRRGHRALLEHLLHQIDAAARRIALVPEKHIGRTGGGAEAAMYATPEHGVGPGDGRILELLVGEIGVHGRLDPWIHAARIENAGRIEGCFQSAGQRCERRLERLEHIDARAGRALGADQRGMASIFGDGAADLDRACVGGGGRLEPDQAPRPVISNAEVEGA